MTPYRSLIEETATRYQLDPNLVEAIVIHESNGCADAFRHEDGFWRTYMAGKPEWTNCNPRRVASSYGLCQVLYTTALLYGFKAQPEYLFLPNVNLEYGCQHLLACLKKHNGEVAPALMAYNGGESGSPESQRYATLVLKLLESVKAAHP